MENKTISRTLRLLSQLMELNDENPFKIRSVANAAFKIDKLPFPIAKKPFEEIDKIDGIGKSIAAKIIELLETGTIQELEDSLQQIPPGVVEMLSIKGIGAKKVGIIWHDLQIENVGELKPKVLDLKLKKKLNKKLSLKWLPTASFYMHM
jgi:DNA polymerase (family 10)